MNYWLMKSEPDVYSIEDLEREKKAHWDGVRNYQARNIMRDQMKKGDMVLFYHSNADPSGVAGIAKVVKEAYPDHTAQNPKSEYYDPKSTSESPRWMMVDIGFVEKFKRVVPLHELKASPLLSQMMVVRRGARLSVQPVSKKEFEIIREMSARF